VIEIGEHRLHFRNLARNANKIYLQLRLVGNLPLVPLEALLGRITTAIEVVTAFNTRGETAAVMYVFGTPPFHILSHRLFSCYPVLMYHTRQLRTSSSILLPLGCSFNV